MPNLPPNPPRHKKQRAVISGLNTISSSTLSTTTGGGSGRAGSGVGSSTGSNDNALDDNTSYASSAVSAGGMSVNSTYRHHQAGQFMPESSRASAPERPQPVLVKDSRHKPKTVGSVGIMVVGLGGANGCTLLAGILANRMNLAWKGPVGQDKTANYLGCITQLNQKGRHGGVGYADKVRGLANASMAAIGGWVRVFCRVFLPFFKNIFTAHYFGLAKEELGVNGLTKMQA